MIRTDIRNAIFDDLATITIANSYNLDLQKVYKTFKVLSDIKDNQFPCASVLEGNSIKKYSGESEMVEWTLAITGYLKVNKDFEDEGTLDQEIDKFLEDIETLFDTLTNLEKVTEVESLEILGYMPDESNYGNTGMVYIPMKITYKN